MAFEFRIRRPVAQDAAAMARVHVKTWRETYRGLMRDELLDHPGFEASRTRFWTAALIDARYERNRIAVAENGSELIGIAIAGPPMDADATWQAQLYLYLRVRRASRRRRGQCTARRRARAGAHRLALGRRPNLRVQAFYGRHRFALDGASKVDDGVRETRMVRGAA